mgnify:CR=1 FL=1
MAKITMTLEEYEALLASRNLRETGAKGNSRIAPKKRVGKKDPKMAKALKKANSMMRTKSGKLRKGATQAKIMKKAHALRRKMR